MNEASSNGKSNIPMPEIFNKIINQIAIFIRVTDILIHHVLFFLEVVHRSFDYTSLRFGENR